MKQLAVLEEVPKINAAAALSQFYVRFGVLLCCFEPLDCSRGGGFNSRRNAHYRACLHAVKNATAQRTAQPRANVALIPMWSLFQTTGWQRSPQLRFMASGVCSGRWGSKEPVLILVKSTSFEFFQNVACSKLHCV